MWPSVLAIASFHSTRPMTMPATRQTASPMAAATSSGWDLTPVASSSSTLTVGMVSLTPKFQMPETPINSVIEGLENPHEPASGR
jgi:hypothetical protein